MGFLDRFKKEQAAAAPDALTREAAARVRAVPGVVAVEAVDADTLSVTWSGLEEAAPLSLAGIRDRWSAARGFDRIEVMDEFVAGVAPPVAGPSTPPPPPESHTSESAAEPPAAGTGPTEPAAPETDAAAAWEAARPRLRPVVGRPGAPDADTVHWTVGGVLEATVVLDDPVALPVGRAELLEWGVDDATVRAAAEQNLASTDPGLDPIGPDAPAWVPTRPDGHLAGWLCAPHRLLEAAGLDEAVVLAPLPSELVVVDPAATDLVASVLTSTRTIVEQQTRTLWPAPFLARREGVEPWEPAADHPCAPLVEEMRRLG